MKRPVSVNTQNMDAYLEEYFVLVCSVRNSRIKAKRLAILEVLTCLYPLQGLFITNGPLSDIRGMISFFIPRVHKAILDDYLKNLGYCNKFYILDFDNPAFTDTSGIPGIKSPVWKKKRFSVRPFYEQSQDLYIEQSPHRRHFRIRGHDGSVMDLYGYRGDGTERGRRALPVEDARCMVNLAIPSKIKKVIDPFAGAGGIVYQAKYMDKNIQVFSADIDESLEPGLSLYGAKHLVANSAEIDFKSHIFDAVITEVPFSLDALDDICNTLNNLDKHLHQSARIVMMFSEQQLKSIKKYVKMLNWYIVKSAHVNRKGTDVVVMLIVKSYKMYEKAKKIGELLKYIS